MLAAKNFWWELVNSRTYAQDVPRGLEATFPPRSQNASPAPISRGSCASSSNRILPLVPN